MSPTKSKSKIGFHKPGRKERLGSKDTELAAPVEQTHQMVIMTIYIMVRCRADEVIIYPHRNLLTSPLKKIQNMKLKKTLTMKLPRWQEVPASQGKEPTQLS